MTKLSDLDFYQSPWLSLTDLSGRAARVAISEVTVEEVRQRDNTKARKVVLSFTGKKKRLICNVTQATAAQAAWGDHLEGWVGKHCILQPGRAENGKETILLVPVPPAAELPATTAPATQQDTGQQHAAATSVAQSGASGSQAAELAMSEAEKAALWAPNGSRLVDPAWAG